MVTRLTAEREGVSLHVGLKSDDAIARLRALKAADEELGRWLAQAVGEARRAGRSWEEIGDALGVSRQAAWQLYNSELRAAIDRVRDRASLSDAEALDIATGEVRNVRSRHRR